MVIPYSPIVQLFLSGLHTQHDIEVIYRNYHRTESDKGIASLCGGIHYDAKERSKNDELRKLLKGPIRGWTFLQSRHAQSKEFAPAWISKHQNVMTQHGAFALFGGFSLFLSTAFSTA